MEAYIPLLCLLFLAILLWRQASAAPPVVWTRGRVAAAVAAALGALAVPLVVAAIISGQ